MWWRRRRVPWWLMVLAFLGFKSVLRAGRYRAEPDFYERRDRFRTKLDEAFDVWREPRSEASTEESSEAE